MNHSSSRCAENRTRFLSLCVCGLTNKPVMYKKFNNTWAAGRWEASTQFSSNQSIVAEFRRALCFQATKRLICKKVCFKRSRKFQVKKRFDRPRKLLPGSVGSSFKVHMCWYVVESLMYRIRLLCSVKTKLSRVLIQKQSYKLSMRSVAWRH